MRGVINRDHVLSLSTLTFMSVQADNVVLKYKSDIAGTHEDREDVWLSCVGVSRQSSGQ